MNQIAKLIVSKCIKIGNHKEPFFDFTTITTNKNDLIRIVEALKSIVEKLKVDTVIGHGYGGTQLVSALVASSLKVNGIIVRSTPHPTQKRQIEGDMYKAKNILILDDAIFTGNTIEKILAVLTPEQQKKLKAIAVIYDDWRPNGTRRIEQQYKLPVYSLVHRHEIGMTRDADTDLQDSVFENAIVHKTEFNIHNLLFADYYSSNKSDWKMKTSPIWHGDFLINATDDYTVSCYDPKKQIIQWQHRLKGGVPNNIAPSKGIVQDFLKIVDNSLYISAYDGSVTKIDANTGQIYWETKIDRYVHSTPVVYKNKVYVNTESWFEHANRGGGSISCLDSNDGNILWKHTYDDYAPSTVFIDDNKVYSNCNDGSFNCFDSETGSLLWKCITTNECKTPCIKIDSHLYILDVNGWLYKIDLNGIIKWKIKVVFDGWQVFPLYYNGCIFVYSRNQNYIFAHNPVSGERVWISKLRSPVVGIQLLSDNHMFVTCSDTQVVYYENFYKVWELNSKIPNSNVYSRASINKSNSMIAFNTVGGGLQIYSI